ncbi:oligosaccharide flippase family protein [Rhizobium skierniewicense]|uniref:lipopolysaccharide biosynthesis protein n=1 Tax=Rhizobium skierniewicense TaxID=984260 RepID=UPI0009E4A0BF|nr:oligosaccharide flippase family protein [Rhizobium skierniewicense]MCI9868153.1 oligosaccharide flippase family protein [Rhizobium skierniewicense]
MSRTLFSAVKRRLSGLLGNDAHGMQKGFIVLLLGATSAKLITILVMPILTRMYTPEDFGLYAIFNTVVNFLYPFVTLRYVLAIPLPRRERSAFLLLALCLAMTLLSAPIISVGLLIFGEHLGNALGAPQIGTYWWILVLGTTGAGLYEVALQWAIRGRRFKNIAGSQFNQSISGAVIKIALGWWHPAALNLLIGGVAERTMGILSLLRGMSKMDIPSLFTRASLGRLFFFFRYYREMPTFRLPAQILAGLATQIPILMIAYAYGSETVGQLSLAFSILFATVNLIGQTTSKAFIGILSKIGRHRPKEILSLLISTCKKSAIISAGPVLVLLIGGRPLFEFAFGGQWSQAGTFAQYLAPLLFAQLLVSPTASVISVLNKNKYNLRISFERCCLSVIPFVFALYYAMDPKYVIAFYSLLLVVHYGTILLTTVTMLKKEITRHALEG